MAMKDELSTLEAARRAITGRSPSLPLITFYDDATSERVELSAATFANWVAKTANFISDEFDVANGYVVRVRLPLHWVTAVWFAACAAVGVPVELGPSRPSDRFLVVGPAELAPVTTGARVVACALRPLGAGFAEPLPDHVIDFSAEVLGFGDSFDPPPEQRPGAESPALVADGLRLTNSDALAEARRLAASWELGQSGRLMVTTAGIVTGIEPALALFAVPAALGASVVLVANPAAVAMEHRTQSERVTATARL